MTRNYTLDEINQKAVKYGTGRYAVTFETGDTIQEFADLKWAIEFAKWCREEDERRVTEGDEEEADYYDIHDKVTDAWINGADINEYETDEWINRYYLDGGLGMAGVRPLGALIGVLPYCRTENDVIRKLDAMNTSREINWLDENGNTVLAGDPKAFLAKVAQPDRNGSAEWYGVMDCGKYQAIMHCFGEDWSDDDQMFLEQTAEIIGWR